MLLLQVHTMITYTDTYISHKCATWNAIQKVECSSHCKPESTIHRSEKLRFTFLCKSNIKVELESNAQAAYMHVQK